MINLSPNRRGLNRGPTEIELDTKHLSNMIYGNTNTNVQRRTRGPKLEDDDFSIITPISRRS